MRASDVKDTIIAAVEGATVDTKASSVDIFTHVNVGTREMRAARDRLFTVSLSTIPVREGTMFPTALYGASWDLTVMYSDSPAVEDRISQDFERISRALDPLAGDNADICKIQLVGGPVTELDGLVMATIGIQIAYKLDSTI